ncbi:hypothetical protein OG897_39380 [Streptomyces sp. NBC_00237]|uniref:hypothetical protein n=1 Tax=Streptomyces sp. NBC_00237 TaxID=2975687 RepID=UPI00224C9B8E|nr:hypothetical protein [Streptomyces sp. NBC_00237]MCX5207452.1 hypothetical protein [Streptomyces sp. NBC_00237]
MNNTRFRRTLLAATTLAVATLTTVGTAAATPSQGGGELFHGVVTAPVKVHEDIDPTSPSEVTLPKGYEVLIICKLDGWFLLLNEESIDEDEPEIGWARSTSIRVQGKQPTTC